MMSDFYPLIAHNFQAFYRTKRTEKLVQLFIRKVLREVVDYEVSLLRINFLVAAVIISSILLGIVMGLIDKLHF